MIMIITILIELFAQARRFRTPSRPNDLDGYLPWFANVDAESYGV